MQSLPFSNVALRAALDSVHAATRLSCTSAAFHRHLHDDHECWSHFLEQHLAGESRPHRLSAKLACLDTLGRSCSLCGGRGDIELHLDASKKCACSRCVCLDAGRCKQLAAVDTFIRSKQKVLHVVSRRRALEPVLKAPFLREILGADPARGAATPELIFSTRCCGKTSDVDDRARSHPPAR